MRTLAICLLLLCSNAHALDKAAFTEADAIKEIAAGACGKLGLGTGLVGGKGWLHQPIPGKVVIRTESATGTIQTIAMRANGTPPQHEVVIDMNAGQPYYVMVKWAMSNDRLVWKVPGHSEGPVPIGFQLPPTR